mmetsp:Transcript_83920/g.166567  ORF Transcript_83920/g.166567 Transcript_83920/m.166567 type:complete len:841 (-) Transcript_83920:57-2579(-)
MLPQHLPHPGTSCLRPCGIRRRIQRRLLKVGALLLLTPVVTPLMLAFLPWEVQLQFAAPWTLQQQHPTITSVGHMRCKQQMPFGCASQPSLLGKTLGAATIGVASLAVAAVALASKGRPRLDYPPPPVAALAWPRWLSWYWVVRRKLFGGAEAVALDPSLPTSVRWELIQARRELRGRADGAPRSFRRMLREISDTLEEVPALLVTVSVLTGDLLRKPRVPLGQFRKLGQAQALLFTAGQLHLGILEGGEGNMRLLGGDFLYAEGQWMLAELGNLPTIKTISAMIRDISDGASSGGSAAGSSAESYVGLVGPKAALFAAFLKVGTYFASVTSGAAWIAGAPPATVAAMRQYGSDLGCALKLAQYKEDAASQDCALWLARSAQAALLPFSASTSAAAALRGMTRLAYRVERSCAKTLDGLLKQSSTANYKGLSFGEFEELRLSLDEQYVYPDGDEGEAPPVSGLGFSRNVDADGELERLIATGLGSGPVPGAKAVPAPKWPEEGPKAALEGSLVCIGKELMKVNKILNSTPFAENAESELVRKAIGRLFGSGGKRLRPALVLLIARALGAPDASLERVTGLAASIEVLHSASLVHDDILDGADKRRGEETTHIEHGERAATLVGDFLFGTASCLVADLGNLPTVLLISKVVADFGRGELAQSAVRFEAIDYSLEDYLAKSFYKTASLLAAACHAAAVLSGVPPCSQKAQSCYRFGAYVGLAFQVVDDVLDFTSTEEELGKPALADLKEGNLGAPVLYAAQKQALGTDAREELLSILERRLSGNSDLDRVRDLVNEAGGVDRAKQLARRFIDLAATELSVLPSSGAREGLRIFAEFVVARTY